MAAKLATIDESSRANKKPQAGEMKFDCGYISPFFITDPERMEVVLENAYILLHQGKITSKNDLIPLLKQFTNKGKSLLIIAEGVEGEALATLVVKKVSGFLQVAAVSASGLGNQRKSLLHDIALLTGGKAMQGLDTQLKNIRISDLGLAKKIVIDKNRTVIESGATYHQLCSSVPSKSYPAADSNQNGKREYSSTQPANV